MGGLQYVFRLVFGVLALVTGLGILVWVGYNLLVQRQPEFTGFRSVALPMAMVALGWKWLRGSR